MAPSDLQRRGVWAEKAPVFTPGMNRAPTLTLQNYIP